MQVVHHGCKARRSLRQDLGGPDIDDGGKRGGLGPQLGAPKFKLFQTLPTRVIGLGQVLRRPQEVIHGPKPAREGDEEAQHRVSLQGRTIKTVLIEYEQKAILAGMMTGNEQHGLFHVMNLKKVLPDRLIGAMANI